MSEQKIIKRYISQKCIGYTASRKPICNCLVEYMDGSTGIIEEIGGKTEAITPYPERIVDIDLPYRSPRKRSLMTLSIPYAWIDDDTIVEK